MKQVAFFICLILLSLCSLAQEDVSQFKADSIVDGKDTLRYRLLYPSNFSNENQYPLVIFLHGAGERGHDNTSQLKYAVPFFQNIEKQNPSIIIVPQCPDSSFWAKVKTTPGNYFNPKPEFTFYPDGNPTPAMKCLITLAKKWHAEKFVNKNQIYIGGLSMGGMGTYELLIRRPIPFTAAFVICGGTNVITLKNKIGKTPIWIFHGEQDPIVSVDYARQIYAMMKREDKEVKYTEYPGVGHDSWLKALQEKDLIPWLFQHKR